MNVQVKAEYTSALKEREEAQKRLDEALIKLVKVLDQIPFEQRVHNYESISKFEKG